ncbi:MAG: ABC transporter ATP-binding protein, partial [Acidobacteriota bacterium]
MNESSIEFRNVSLDFKLSNEGGINSFKEWAIRCVTRKLSYRTMLALDNLTSDIPSGATLGVIGHNGA